jgi:hypothetical protein
VLKDLTLIFVIRVGHLYGILYARHASYVGPAKPPSTPSLIAHPHLPVRATIERFLPTRGHF